MRHLVIPITVLFAILAAPAEAQGVTSANSDAIHADTPLPRPVNDSLFRRARRLVGEGNGVAGRALVDSLLASTDPATAAYGDALYWHGALAPTAAEAERDYRRVIVEFPLAFYSGDALLAIAELEQARGDRAGAMQHLQRFVREHPANPGRGLAALGAARLAFEQRDSTVGCAMLAEARASAAPTNVELRNQVDYFSGRCSAVAASVAPTPAAPSQAVATTPTPAVASPPPAEPPSVKTPRAASRSTTSYTIQVAAYNTRTEAERLVAKLATRGIKARVSGNTAPFRVRLAFYRTRKEAANEVLALKRRGIVSFVAEEAHAGAPSP
jgi:cell division septation protein DedD